MRLCLCIPLRGMRLCLCIPLRGMRLCLCIPLRGMRLCLCIPLRGMSLASLGVGTSVAEAPSVPTPAAQDRFRRVGGLASRRGSLSPDTCSAGSVPKGWKTRLSPRLPQSRHLQRRIGSEGLEDSPLSAIPQPRLLQRGIGCEGLIGGAVSVFRSQGRGEDLAQRSLGDLGGWFFPTATGLRSPSAKARRPWRSAPRSQPQGNPANSPPNPAAAL